MSVIDGFGLVTKALVRRGWQLSNLPKSGTTKYSLFILSTSKSQPSIKLKWNSIKFILNFIQQHQQNNTNNVHKNTTSKWMCVYHTIAEVRKWMSGKVPKQYNNLVGGKFTQTKQQCVDNVNELGVRKMRWQFSQITGLPSTIHRASAGVSLSSVFSFLVQQELAFSPLPLNQLLVFVDEGAHFFGPVLRSQSSRVECCVDDRAVNEQELKIEQN